MAALIDRQTEAAAAASTDELATPSTRRLALLAPLLLAATLAVTPSVPAPVELATA
jgi:hypothetical protein